MKMLAGRDSHLLTSKLIASLERMRCEVRKEGNRLLVAMPGLDSCVEIEDRFPFVRNFWDRMEIEISPRSSLSPSRFPRFKHSYATPFQIALHLGIFLLFCLASLRRNIALHALAQALPWLSSWVNFAWVRNRIQAQFE